MNIEKKRKKKRRGHYLLTMTLRGRLNATFGRQSQGIGWVNPNRREDRLEATQTLEVGTTNH